jgi:hypothetical protein
MPKKPIDYSKCCIYKIEHIENENLLYVGHTTCFNKRKGHHKSRCNNENNKLYNCKLYQMIRNNGGFEMFRMIEIEKFSCNDKREAEKKENEVMKQFKANMNTYKSYSTEEEKKLYNEDYFKDYYKENKEKYKDYRELNKERSKEYREKNKETIKEKNKEYGKQYREKNKEKDKEYYEKNKIKFICSCGCEVLKQCVKKHQMTKKNIFI